MPDPAMTDDEAFERAKQGEGWTRRRFVKTSLAAGAVGAAGATGAMALASTYQRREKSPSFPYLGVRVLPNSKAPKGIPLIPVRMGSGGELEGVPDRLHWYKYCGRDKAPGLSDDFDSDNKFRYYGVSADLEQARSEGIDVWYESKLGQVATVPDFDEPGKGAMALWRSEGDAARDPLPCLLLRVDPADYDAEVAAQFFPDGVLAVFSTCAHFCCTPTYRVSRQGFGQGHWDEFTCHCHGSWYDPRDIVEYQFPPTA